MSGRRYRRKESDSDDDESSEKQSVSSVLADIRDVQKLRKRPAGVNINEMLASEKESFNLGKPKTDPFKLKTGGFVDLRKMKQSDLKEGDIEEGIKQTFSKESHLRDEDEEMRRYVEQEVSKRKGQNVDSDDSKAENSTTKNVDDVLFQLPEHLKRYQSKKTEEMLSNQMLCGIPEVDLGIESKIRNIEETEAAKLKLLKEALEKKRNLKEKLTARQNLAKNLAKSYVQHNIYNIEETTLVGSESVRAKPKRPRTEPVPVVDDDTPKWVEDGRTVEKPDFASRPKHRRPDTTKPTDKQMRDKFKEKFVKKK